MDEPLFHASCPVRPDQVRLAPDALAYCQQMLESVVDVPQPRLREYLKWSQALPDGSLRLHLDFGDDETVEIILPFGVWSQPFIQ